METSDETGQTYVKPSELAKMLSVSEQSIRNWTKNGTIPKEAILKVGSVYRFDQKKVIEALQHKENDDE